MRKSRFYYYYRLFKWHALRDRSPIGASIKITQRCNLRCRHCVWEKHSEERFGSEWRKTVDELYAQGVSVIAVEGGEPTLHPAASDIVQYIRNRGMYCIVITNGTSGITGLEPDAFWISVDGMEAAHDRMRGNGVFQRVMQTIQENNGRALFTLTSLSRDNVQDLEALCDHLSPHVTGLIFNFIYPYRNIPEPALDRTERASAARRLLEIKRRNAKVVNSETYLGSVGKYKTVYPWLLITVTSEGRKMQGCMVRHIEEEDCSRCDMGCCSELSHAFALKPDALRFWTRTAGLPRLLEWS